MAHVSAGYFAAPNGLNRRKITHPKLQHLNFYSLRSDAGLHVKHMDLHNLRELLVSELDTVAELVQIARYLPQLEALTIKCLLSEEDPALAPSQREQEADLEALQPLNLTDLTLPDLRMLDSRMQILISLMTKLQHVIIIGTTYRVVQTLADHCPLLETLTVEVVETEEGGNANPLFDQCPRLRVVKGIRLQVWTTVIKRDTPWVCMDLEHLECQMVNVIRGLPIKAEAITSEFNVVCHELRLQRAETVAAMELMYRETPENQNPSPSEALELCRKILARFDMVLDAFETMAECSEEDEGGEDRAYKQLSQLTKLRYLDLGYNQDEIRRLTRQEGREIIKNGRVYIYYDEPVESSLKLSLEAGLGMLSTLRDLEVFGFRGFDHSIGEEELQWMASSWPKLKTLRGLEGCVIDGVEFDEDAMELKDIMQQLRPDIRVSEELDAL
ncbi:hypothetical protein BGX28_003186 [Mortierella sp. GBA30]|nr:hypothetical protein BGX28_003186 [Mortierella sp. GBA30]